jgi:hypothetical protein
MYYVQPVQPILGLRPIGLVYCNPSLLGYIMKVTPLIRVCGVSLQFGVAPAKTAPYYVLWNTTDTCLTLQAQLHCWCGSY